MPGKNILSIIILFSTWISFFVVDSFCNFQIKSTKWYLKSWQSDIILPNKIKLGTELYGSSKWDYLVDDDEDFEPQGQDIPKDMRYIEFNILRQNKHFVAIREAGGSSVTNDIYVRDSNSQTFWFCGKVARISDVSVEQAVARQYPLIEEHAARLRPLELYPKRGSLEIWTAPGDSELDVAYNRPNVQFVKMKRVDQVEGAENIRNIEIGFQGEIYESGEEGFRTLRTEDGLPLKPEIEQPKGEKRAPTDEEMAQISELLKDKDINELFKDSNEN